MASRANSWLLSIEEILSVVGPLTDTDVPADGRRRDFVEKLSRFLGADFVFWAWGRGHPARGPVVPVATIATGVSAANRGWPAVALSPLVDREIRAPILPFVRPQATQIRRNLFSDARWKKSEVRRTFMKGMGTDEWMLAVRYCGDDTWCNLFIARRKGKPPFDESQRALVDSVLRHVKLLHSAVSESELPPAMMKDLTLRQRTVLHAMLDGQSRKLMAENLKISQHTVNEHMKAIFQHFGVRSAPALAARFLRSK